MVSQRYVLLIGTVLESNFRYYYGNVYARNVDADREVFEAELHAIIVESSVSWILSGDFNVVRTMKEKMSISFNQASMDFFSDFIDTLGLTNLPLLGGRYTWCNNKELATHCPLDRFLVTPEVINANPD